MTSYFVIVSREDHVIYEADLGSGTKGTVTLLKDRSYRCKKDDSSHLQQFILHAALDPIDDRLWDASGMNLRVVDKFNDLLVSAYVTAGRTRLLLLHDNRNDDGIHAFFKEVHELVLKVQLNPFQEANAPITVPTFDQRVRLVGRKYL